MKVLIAIVFLFLGYAWGQADLSGGDNLVDEIRPALTELQDFLDQ